MKTTRRAFVQTIGLGGVAAALGGCDSASEALLSLIEPAAGADFAPPTSAQIDLTAHVLNRLTYGSVPGDYARVAGMGVEAFIEQQLDPRSISDRRSDWKAASIESLAQATPELYDIPAQQLLDDLTRARMLRAVYSKRQLFEIMVEFWTDHFNIVSEKGECKWLKAADDRDVIRKHALGSFRELVRASAVSPAMLIYLDGHDNKVERPGDRPNENYARELLELHTLGVNGGYSQKDVMEVARCLSGWTFTRHPFRFSDVTAEFVPARHDDGEKIVLGRRISPGGGAADLDRVLDLVCAHPSTAKFVATKLCRRFIADPPTEQSIAEVASAFTQSSGDIRATLRALFGCEEFRNPSCRGVLFKRPQHFVISALRATDAKTSIGPSMLETLRRMGHAPFQYPTPDGYPLEQQPWLGTLLWRWNFALALQANQLDGTSIDLDAWVAKLGGAQLAAAHVLGRTPTDLEMEAVNTSPSALALMLASPAFQRF